MQPDLSREELQRYARHVVIPEVGIDGQRRLKAASVLIVGVGGLGSPVAMYLAAAGVGRIGLVDADNVAVTNLQRQIIHGTAQVGRPKVESARGRMLDINPDIRVDAYTEQFTAANAQRIAADYPILIDCTDNFPSRYLISDLCVLEGKTFIYGSIYRFEGQVSTFDPRRGPCYRCLFPEPPSHGTVPGCAQSGVFGVLPGTIGTLQASEAIKLILGTGTPLTGKLLLYNALDMSFETVRLNKNPQCKACGANPEITHLIDYDAYCSGGADAIRARTAPEVSPRQAADWIKAGRTVKLVDVREARERDIASIPGALWIPLSELDSHMDELNADDEIIVFCRQDLRANLAYARLRERGFHNVKRLAGGITAWSREVDPDILIY